MAEKGVDVEKGRKMTSQTQEEEILMNKYLYNTKSDDYKNNDKKKMAWEAISKVIKEGSFSQAYEMRHLAPVLKPTASPTFHAFLPFLLLMHT